MGPIRRGLILAAIPGPAFAGVCDQVRPLWSPNGIDVNIWSEPLYTLTNPLLFMMIIIALAGSAFRHVALQMAGIVASSFLLMFVSQRLWASDDLGIWARATAEGCIAPPYVTTAFAAALTVYTIIRALRRIRNQRN
jgi:hypothetical protein